MTVEFKILGSVAVADGDTDIALPGVKLRTLLALLLIRNGEVTRAERLADDLWARRCQPDTRTRCSR